MAFLSKRQLGCFRMVKVMLCTCVMGMSPGESSLHLADQGLSCAASVVMDAASHNPAFTCTWTPGGNDTEISAPSVNQAVRRLFELMGPEVNTKHHQMAFLLLAILWPASTEKEPRCQAEG